MEYGIREVRSEDVDEIAYVEPVCLPAAGAASRGTLEKRTQISPGGFFAVVDNGWIIGLISGVMTGNRVIQDETHEGIGLHNPEGAYQNVFGLDMLSEYQRWGIATDLMKYLIEEVGKYGREDLVLTCRDRLIPFYGKFGYRNMGLSESVHDNTVWYGMILELQLRRFSLVGFREKGNVMRLDPQDGK